MLPTPSSPPRSGRPRALDEVKRGEICALISAGFGIPDAADYVGCAPSTIRREARRNAEFNAALRRARLAAELEPLHSMRQFAKKYWRAAAWLLERINTQRFGKQNVAHIKPECLDVYVDHMAEVLIDETRQKDPEVRRRISQRLKEIEKQAKFDLLAKLEPVPKPRRRRPQQFPSDWANRETLEPVGPSTHLPPDNLDGHLVCDSSTPGPDSRQDCDNGAHQST